MMRSRRDRQRGNRHRGQRRLQLTPRSSPCDVQCTWRCRIAGSIGNDTAPGVSRAIDGLDHVENIQALDVDEGLITTGRSWQRTHPTCPHERTHHLRNEPRCRLQRSGEIGALQSSRRAVQNHQRTHGKIGSLRDFESHTMKLMNYRERDQGQRSLASVDDTTNTDSVVSTVPNDVVARSWLARGVWFGAGWLAVAVGGIGVVVPGLPTTGFMIIAAACFARCSPRFEQWVLNLPGVGRSVADYRSGAGMPKRAKITAISMMAIAISISVGLVLDNTALRISVVALGLVGVWYIVWRVPTAAEDRP